jgi:Ca2+-binding RTX toxin-like protein
VAVYTVTSSNWNDPAFWSSINAANNDTLDMSSLGAGFTATVNTTTDRITISDGTTSFTIGGDSNTGTPNASLGSGRISDFDTIYAPSGGADVRTHSGEQALHGSDGDDTIDGGDGNDSIYGEGGDDYIDAGEEYAVGDDDYVSGGDGNDTIVSRAPRFLTVFAATA